jgi:hypothetical protein
MLNRLQALALAALVGSGVLALTPVTSRAVALPAPRLSDAVPQLGKDRSIEQVANRYQRRRQWFYNRHYRGHRYNYPYRNYRYYPYYNYHYYNDDYYGYPYFNFYFPFYYGGYGYNYGYYNNYGHGNYGSRHVRWCLNRYRSYNVRTNTWVSYSGAVRQCVSPYGP